MCSSPWRSLWRPLGPLFLFAMFLFSGTLSGACAPQAPTVLRGRMASGGGFLGDWDFFPGTCVVHHDEVVLLEDKSGREQVRLVDRTQNPSTRNAKIDVHVARETDKGTVDLIFTDPACVKSAMQGGPQGYSGEVAIDCQTGEGGRVVGKITFQGCR
jgi:hypothetical protein